MEVLEAARRAGGPQVVVASSSSVYGANPALPKREDMATLPVSPYAAGKLAAEAATLAYGHSFGLPTLAFRFFNVFGPLQAADHAYAAVVPAFVAAALRDEPIPVHGDGLQTRDFTYVGTVAAVLTDAVLRRVTARGRSTWPSGPGSPCSTWSDGWRRSSADPSPGPTTSRGPATCATPRPTPPGSGRSSPRSSRSSWRPDCRPRWTGSGACPEHHRSGRPVPGPRPRPGPARTPVRSGPGGGGSGPGRGGRAGWCPGRPPPRGQRHRPMGVLRRGPRRGRGRWSAS